MKSSIRFAAALLVALVAIACLGQSSPDPNVVTITAEGLHKRLVAGEKPLVVDVREQAEYDAGHIDGAKLVPLSTVEEGLKSVPKDQDIVLVCRSGRRSGKAYVQLAAKGYTKMANMTGGMLDWQKMGYPVVKK